MKFDFSDLDYEFIHKPLLFGGKALEYHVVRQAGKDIDFIVANEDVFALANIYPDKIQIAGNDFGVAVYGFEFWRTVWGLDYEFYSLYALDESNFLVASLEKLLLIAANVLPNPKYVNDAELIARKLTLIKQVENIKGGSHGNYNHFRG